MRRDNTTAETGLYNQLSSEATSRANLNNLAFVSGEAVVQRDGDVTTDNHSEVISVYDLDETVAETSKQLF
jgi:hypothetical protein